MDYTLSATLCAPMHKHVQAVRRDAGAPLPSLDDWDDDESGDEPMRRQPTVSHRLQLAAACLG